MSGNEDIDPEELFRTVDLQKIKFGTIASAPEEVFLHNPKIEVFRDHMMQILVLRMSGYIWADPPKEIRVMYPRDWWEALKERWFPEWALEAWPVEYEITTLEAQTIYPRLPYEAPEHQPWLRMAIHNPREWRRQ